MKANPVYRNILFSPKIWGLKFTSMVFCMLTMIIGFIMGVGGIFGKFFFTIFLTGISFAFWYWKDNRDEVAYHSRKYCRIKRVAASYSLTKRFIVIE